LAFALLRDAQWMTGRRFRDYATILIAVYVVAALWTLAGHGIDDPLGRPVGTDFLSFWTVSSALHTGQSRAVYAPLELAALERAVAGSDGFYAWAYPPLALLLVYPLALMPYLWSLAAWLACGLGAYLTALWRILPRPATLWAGLAFPAVLANLSHGQNGLLTTGLLGWALLLLPQRPGLAGALLGLLTFKPQLGLMIPLALAAGGHWRTMVVAALTAIGLAALSLALFGGELWSGFLGSLPFARAMLEQELVPYYKMQSVFAASRLLGASVSLAYILQGIVALGAAWITIATWRQPIDQDLKNAVLVTAGVLAAPFILDYDLMLLALPAAWLLCRGWRSGALPWEKVTVAAICVIPLTARMIAYWTDLALAPLAEAALLAALIMRIRIEQNAPDRAQRRSDASSRGTVGIASAMPADQ
jgi:alpha-1,2-mannosyltransferase